MLKGDFMDDEIKNEYFKVKDLISEEEFLDKCEELHHRIGLSAKDSSRYRKSSNNHLNFHDKNDFPIKGVYDYTVNNFPLTDLDISKILSCSLLENIDLIDTDCEYAIIYNREPFLGNFVEFVKKESMYDEDLINLFKKELSDYILNFCEEGDILKRLGKNYADFDSIKHLISFLKTKVNEFPSLNWSLEHYKKYSNDFNTVKEFYVMIVEFDYTYEFTKMDIPLEIPYERQINFFNELMRQYANDIYKRYTDSYDFWDQYGPDSYYL